MPHARGAVLLTHHDGGAVRAFIPKSARDRSTGPRTINPLHDFVIAKLEHARARQPLNPVRDVEAQMLRLEVRRADDTLGIVASLGNPCARGGGMRAREVA